MKVTITWRRLTEYNPHSGEVISATILTNPNSTDLSEALFELIEESQFIFHSINDRIEIKVIQGEGVLHG